jgi:peptidoglycan/LPS O-acetylase OafA/YrhL
LKKSRLQFLDTLRGIAILGVFFYHGAMEISRVAMAWKDGLWDPHGFDPPRALFQYALQCYSVPSMFFLISGFLIHRFQCSGRIVDVQYLARRNLRLYLPYLVVLALFSAAYLLPQKPTYPGPDALQLATHVLLLFNFMGGESLWAINPSFWFVGVEIQLCFAYLLWRKVIGRFGWGWMLGALLLVELLARTGAAAGYKPLYGTPLCYGFTWMLGAYLAERQALRTLPSGSGRKAALWGIVIVLATGVEKLEYFASLALAMATYYLLSYLLHRDEVRGDQPAPLGLPGKLLTFVRQVGQISLWAYLLNQPILQYITRALEGAVPDPLQRIFASALVGWVIVLPLSWLMFRFVEPLLVRFIDMLMGSQRKVPAMPPAGTP